MNLILFDQAEQACHLPAGDPRTAHVREVLRLGVGERFFVGVVDGPRGRARILTDDAAGLSCEVAWEAAPPPAFPLDLLVATPRPQAARHILAELAALGARRIGFFPAERSEPAYARSKLWSSGEWRRHLRRGAEQAFTTRLPAITHHASLPEALSSAPGEARRLALDVYEADGALGPGLAGARSVTLVLGGERGWGPRDRAHLRVAGFGLVHLGERVLRTETACIAAASLALDALGCLRQAYRPERGA